jgi:hypothetical protein
MMQTIFDLIIEERKRQDIKWGADRMLSDGEWLKIETEEIGEAAKASLEGSPAVYTELIQAAAVLVAWLECIERRNQKEQTHD